MRAHGLARAEVLGLCGSESISPEAVQSPGSDIAGNLGYLDVEAHNPTSEMIFTIRGEGETTDDADFEVRAALACSARFQSSMLECARARPEGGWGVGF